MIRNHQMAAPKRGQAGRASSPPHARPATPWRRAQLLDDALLFGTGVLLAIAFTCVQP